jgi:hypothetical protein
VEVLSLVILYRSVLTSYTLLRQQCREFRVSWD